MQRIATVIVDLSLDREFDYRVPEELADSVRLGSRVAVPFGKARTTGYVVQLSARPDADPADGPGSSRSRRLKSILRVEGQKPYVDETMLRLVRWMGDYYCAPLEAAMRTVLPGAVRRRGAGFKTRKFVELNKPAAEDSKPVPEGQRKRRPSSQQAAVLALLEDRGGMFLDDLTRELGISDSPVRTLAGQGLVEINSCTLHRNPLSKRRILRTAPLHLMPEQAQALARITQAVDELPADGKQAGARSRVMLLHGVTGSGKTEVYLQAIAHTLQQSKGAIVLVPEISLTPQTVERFVSRFGKQIAVLHSHLSQGERHDEWYRIRDGRAGVVVGARSAVFAPVQNLGLIVVDEEHESSYKQEDVPRYHARDVAVMRGKMADCVVVLGSATPALESWYNTGNGKYMLASLPRRADHRRMPAMRIVDMRVEAQRTGKPSMFSRDLIEAVRLRLDRTEQTILFLNRRGYATSLICPRCGFVAGCSQCSVSYTYHRSDGRLRCHICGADAAVPARCPGCGDPSFKFSGIGTQRVESVMKKLFPRAAIQRMDADVTRRKDAYERILGDFRVGKIDILIGTQMIAKGLHFPNVTLVGVIYADLSLHMPDFRAGERTFQLLAQVAGRAGRGDVAGEVIVQTYTPFHWAVQAARRLDYAGLCDQELAFRKELNYPPFAHLVCVTLKGPSQDKVAFSSDALVRAIRSRVSGSVTVADPSPAPLAKAKGRYRYQVMMRARDANAMTRPLKELLRTFKFPPHVTCSVDVDALSLL